MPGGSVPWLKLVLRERGDNLPAQPGLFDGQKDDSGVFLSLPETLRSLTVTDSRAATGTTLGSGERQTPTAGDF